MDQATEVEQPVAQHVFTFDDMRLQVGARLQIQVAIGAKPPHHFTTLIGHVKDEYLIVKIPVENGLSIMMPEQADVIVRALSGVHVFAFTSIVRRVFMAPLFYAHLSFPDKISGTVVRKALRASIEVPVTVTGAQGEGEASAIDASFSNLSATGGFIESPSALGEREHRVRLSFLFRVHPNNREVKIETEATIRNVREATPPGEGAFGYGVRFEGLSEDQTILIQNLVYQSLAENRGA